MATKPSDSFQFKIVKKDGIKAIELLSRPYYQHFLNTKTNVGDIGTMNLTFKKPTRSEQQLRYYAVIVGLLAEYTGDDWESIHECLMTIKFGTREVKLGKDIVKVRYSISNKAMFSKLKMIELIEYAMEKCNELGVVIPTKESLGYINN